MRSVSVVIPVKDGEELLGESLAAVKAQGPEEILVIDSGSTDRSLEIARAAGVDILEIPPAEFGHGRTRNLGAERSTGELIVFLTQDAVPVEGWLAAHREAFDLDPKVGAAIGPHLAWPDTTPMISRELEQFFASMSPDGGPAIERLGGSSFLSNVNASYSRACWEEVRFEDVPYAEDQAFGQALLAAGWCKVFHPGAAVRHAHDYGPLDFARRYYDETKALHRIDGYIEPARPDRVARELRDRVSGDRRWMAEQGYGPGRRAGWTARSALHHTGRKVASVLATRTDKLPPAVERKLSLEGRSTESPAPTPGAVGGTHVPAQRAEAKFGSVLELSRNGAAALDDVPAGTARRDRLHIAFVIPPFRRGGGGHSSIFQLLSRLEGMGHTCSVWVEDATGELYVDPPAVIRRNINDWFTPVKAPAYVGFEHWHGADVVVATGWDTAYRCALLPGCKARAYLVQDHEPEFFATSAERLWAEGTYGLGFYPICASHWLRDLLARRYGCDGTWFTLGVDHGTYHSRPQIQRRRDTVIFYARGSTPRRAVPLGMLALDELVRRRPGTRAVLFGDTHAPATSFPYEHLGVATPGQLAEAYAASTVGLCLSMTNYSLIPQEMLACGLPCVDLAGSSSEAMFGADGPVALAEADPLALAGAIEGLLDDEATWQARSDAGLAYVATAEWDDAARRVETGLRAALRRREPVSAG